MALPFILARLAPMLASHFVRTQTGRYIVMIAVKDAPRVPQIGKLIPLTGLAQMGDEAQERALARNPGRQFRKRRKFNDRSHVITIETLHEILREEFGDGKIAKRAAQICMRGIVTFLQRGTSEFADDAGQTYDSALEDVGNRILEAARDRVLRQTTPRRRTTYRYSKRAI